MPVERFWCLCGLSVQFSWKGNTQMEESTQRILDAIRKRHQGAGHGPTDARTCARARRAAEKLSRKMLEEIDASR